MMLLVNYAFAAWPQVRKVYILTTDASRDRVRSRRLTIPRRGARGPGKRRIGAAEKCARAARKRRPRHSRDRPTAIPRNRARH
jgi:hypothetical protein